MIICNFPCFFISMHPSSTSSIMFLAAYLSSTYTHKQTTVHLYILSRSLSCPPPSLHPYLFLPSTDNFGHPLRARSPGCFFPLPRGSSPGTGTRLFLYVSSILNTLCTIRQALQVLNYKLKDYSHAVFL